VIVFYVPKITNRILYIFNFIFSKVIIVDYELFDNYEVFTECTCKNKVVFDKHPRDNHPFLYIKEILLHRDIIEIQIISDVYEEVPVIFYHVNTKSFLPFDPFAASFYMLTRYEEYLLHTRDEHQRYNYTNSIAYENNFLHLPIVHMWAELLEKKLSELFPELEFKHPKFKFLPTIDVDQAYEHINKGLVRTLGGVLKAVFTGDFLLAREKLPVIWRLKKDPYDNLDYILSLKNEMDLNMIFFFLLSSKGKYDKSNYEYNRSFRNLIRHVHDYADVGIHPSYYSAYEHTELIEKEKTILETILKTNITRSRQHFLRFEIPVTYQSLSDYEIKEDYSMGYASITGFRAGVCVPFNFFDLEDDESTELKIFPLSVMDATLIKYMELDYSNALDEIKRIADIVKEHNGIFISLWHNSSLAGKGIWKNKNNLFKEMLEYVKSIEK
jgi:hypothetical protein